MSVLELCSGAGGFSGLESADKHAILQTMWAVDINENACLSYKVNNPHTHVWNMGLDEFLWMCVLWDELSNKYGDKEEPNLSCSEDEDSKSWATRQKVTAELWDRWLQRQAQQEDELERLAAGLGTGLVHPFSQRVSKTQEGSLGPGQGRDEQGTSCG